MNIVIKRACGTEAGTFGVIMEEFKEPFAVTLERPWLGNVKNISCIPRGEYTCRRVTSPKFGNTFEVVDVSGRSHILFHAGNLKDDSHGCILIGEEFGNINDMPGILSSRKGFNEFMDRLKDVDEFHLTIYQ